MSGDLTSISLLERLRDRNDRVAWQDFHDLYAPLVRSWLISKGVQSANADDLLQEIWQVALAELPAFNHNGHTGALRAWLRRVLSNRLREFWRKERRQPSADESKLFANIGDQLADPQSDLSQAWDLEYRRSICAGLLRQIEDEFEEKTVMSFRRVAIDNVKAAVVAAELGVTANAVRIAQSRVMRRLRQLGQGMLD